MKRNVKGQFLRRTTGEIYESFPIWYDAKGYACIHLAGKDIKLHRYIWEKAYGPIPKGYQLHHIDGNKRNYHIENLMLVTQSDHFKYHANWVKDDGVWVAKPCKDCGKVLPLKEFYPRKGLTPSNICKKCSLIMWKEIGKNPEYKKHRKIYMKNYYEAHK